MLLLYYRRRNVKEKTVERERGEEGGQVKDNKSNVIIVLQKKKC